MQKVLVIAAHPDDEVLGCGGTIARHCARGEEVQALILAEGATARDRTRNVDNHSDSIEDLRASARRAAEILGAKTPIFAGLPDNRLDSLDFLDLVKVIEGIVTELLPTTIYTHHAGDLNVDHRLVHQATLTACRPLPGTPVEAIYTFETLSSTEWSSPNANDYFLPSLFVDIDGYLETKLEALRCYASEMRPYPHARSVESVDALARYRGATMGCNAAEAFSVVRQLVR